MDLGYEGKVALVAASSKGLGRATAEALASEGANVTISGRDEETLAETASQIQDKTGTEVAYLVADVSRADDVENLVSRTVERFGGLDSLVTNAGGPPAGGFEAFADEDWQRAFDLNLMSVVRLIRAALPYLRESDSPRIVNFTSSSIKQPIQNLLLSNVFRTAVLGLAKSLATELAPYGILVNTLGPGRIATDRLFSIDSNVARNQGISEDEVRRRSISQIPLGRYGEPEEFARVATFLASPANTYVTGQALLVDGGMVKAL